MGQNGSMQLEKWSEIPSERSTEVIVRQPVSTGLRSTESRKRKRDIVDYEASVDELKVHSKQVGHSFRQIPVQVDERVKLHGVPGLGVESRMARGTGSCNLQPMASSVVSSKLPGAVPVQFQGSEQRPLCVGQGQAKSRKPVVMPEKFDGSDTWEDYITHFELCADLNGWTPREKGNYLAVSLRGPAQELLGEMSVDMRQNYFILLDTLCTRFGSEGQADLFRAQLKSRQRKSNETLPELAHAVRRLVNRSYPTASREMQEMLTVEYFVEALDDRSMRLQLKQSKLTNLNKVVRLAVELEAINQAEDERSGKGRKYARITQIDEDDNQKHLADKIEVLEQELSVLTEQIGAYMSKLQQSSSVDVSKKSNVRKKSQNWKLEEIDCWNCGEAGHFRNQCSGKKVL